MRSKWSSILGVQLAEVDAICELHFQEKDIKKNYDTLIINGEPVSLEKGINTLEKNALPFCQENTQDKAANSTSYETVREVIVFKTNNLFVFEICLKFIK